MAFSTGVQSGNMNMTFSSEIGDGLLCGSGSNPQDTFATFWAERPAARHNSFAGNGNTMELSQLVNQPVSQEDNLMEQMLDMQFEVCLLARSLAARSHIYKAEDLMISEMQLGLMTSTTGKLNMLKNRKLRLEQLDRELDQTRPARDPPQPAPQPAPEGPEERQPSCPARDPPAREEISIEGGMPSQDIPNIQGAVGQRGITYTCYGREVGENGTLHLQGYLQSTMKNFQRLQMATDGATWKLQRVLVRRLSTTVARTATFGRTEETKSLYRRQTALVCSRLHKQVFNGAWSRWSRCGDRVPPRFSAR